MTIVPEISPRELQNKLKDDHPLVLLDVRETWELERARLRDERLVGIPLSQIAAQGISIFPETTFPPEADVIVICHHGVRSLQVTAWLRSLGWTQVYSLAGGLHAYAIQVDPSISFY